MELNWIDWIAESDPLVSLQAEDWTDILCFCQLIISVQFPAEPDEQVNGSRLQLMLPNRFPTQQHR